MYMGEKTRVSIRSCEFSGSLSEGKAEENGHVEESVDSTKDRGAKRGEKKSA